MAKVLHSSRLPKVMQLVEQVPGPVRAFHCYLGTSRVAVLSRCLLDVQALGLWHCFQE